jgi:thiamine pyrophosphokinase
MRAVIVANGRMKDYALAADLIQPSDFIIAADGGGNHCRAMGIVPALVIGDMDSIDSGLLDELRAAGIEVIRHSPDKDVTDLELAINHALAKAADEILIVGALGARWDMSLSNLTLLARVADSAVAVRIIEGDDSITPVCGGQSLTIAGERGDRVSLLALSGDAEGVVTQGLVYPLRQEPLKFGSSRGVSNRMMSQTARISLQSGLLICIHSRGRQKSDCVYQPR